MAAISLLGVGCGLGLLARSSTSIPPQAQPGPVVVQAMTVSALAPLAPVAALQQPSLASAPR